MHNSKMFIIPIFLVTGILMFVSSGCSECETCPADTGFDSGPDVEIDSGADSGSDVEPDAVDGGSDGGSDGGIHDNPLNLRSVTADEARQLGAYVRKTLVQKKDGDPMPMAWSQINMECNVRMYTAQWALAAKNADGTPATVKEDDITQARIDELVANPVIDSGGLTITGPIATWQKMTNDKGEIVSGVSRFWYWSYHYVPILNVDGEYKVLDLSVGDDPVSIDTWVSGLMEPAVKCERARDQAEYQRIWDYWITVWGSMFEPPFPDRPVPACMYYVFPMLHYDNSGLVVDEYTTHFLPGNMTTQTEIFFKALSEDFDLPDVELSDVPMYLTRYSYSTEDEVCGIVHLNYCDTRKK